MYEKFSVNRGIKFAATKFFLDFFARKGQLAGFTTLREVLPLIFRKAGKVWCGGARETH